MGGFVKGDVVVAPFPFSNLSQSKRRPALVVATLTGSNVILCQITSQAVRDAYAVAIEQEDFTQGGLKQSSYARPNKLFTAEDSIIIYKAGTLTSEKMAEVTAAIINLLQ